MIGLIVVKVKRYLLIF